MSEVDYIVVPEDDDEFDPHYAPDLDAQDEDTEEHPPIPDDLSDFDG